MAKKTATPVTDPLFGSGDPSELAQAREDLKGLNGELTRLNDRYMILLKEQNAEARATRTAAHSQAWHRVAMSYRTYLVGQVREPFASLCGRIAMLPDRPSPDRIERLKEAARDVAELLAAHDDKQTAGLVAEVQRLRDVVQVQAVKLHNQFGTGGRCECPGCELVRSLDDAVQTEDADAAR